MGIHGHLVVAHNIKDLRRGEESLQAFLSATPLTPTREAERAFVCRRCSRWASGDSSLAEGGALRQLTCCSHGGKGG